MSTLTLSNAGLTIGEDLFSNLNLTLGPDTRLGLVAGNGRGKSSLLRVLAGQADLTSGEVIASRGVKIGFVEQDVPAHLLALSMRDAVLDAMTAGQKLSEGWRADVALDELETPSQMRSREVSALSGGWQRLMLIARIWVNGPDMLLLDEPTNHLDLGKILMLENWFNTMVRNMPVVIASHDRAFLDATTNRTLFLRPGHSPDFSQSYSAARAALAEVDEAAERRQALDFKQARKLRKQAAKLTNIGINSGSDLLTVKAKQLKQRAAGIETAAIESHRERPGAIRLSNSGSHAKVMLALDGLRVKTPDGVELFNSDKQFIYQGDRVVVLGENGTGKSLFIKMLRSAMTGELEHDGLRAAPSITLGYVDQALSGLPLTDTPMQFIAGRFPVGDQRARALLADTGFGIDRQQRPIGEMSFGQRSRLVLLALRLAQPNFYLMDEPTNHIDIAGQEALEAEIVEHEASCVLVSHDRSFIRGVGTRYWMIERKKLVEIDGPEPFFERMAAGQG